MRRATVILLVAALSLGFDFGGFERGNRLYRAGRYAEAVEAYQSALADGKGTPELHYNLGTALLALSRFDEAEQHFRQALTTGDTELRQRTYYNLGNRYLLAARGQQDPTQSGALYRSAIEAYKGALRIAPRDADAKWNLELALREEAQQPPSPQGGGEQQQGGPGDQQDQGGGEDEGEPQNNPQSQQPQPQAGQQRQAPLSQQQAERILSAAEQDERDLYRAKLRRGRRDVPVARDW